jgi:hypothetical protein
MWYRAIQPQFWQTSLATAQTKVLPSRFNEGSSARPQFEVLYLAETQMVSLFEVQALFGSPTQPGGVIANPRRPWTVINVQVQLQEVADLTQVSQQTLLATTAQELTGDWYGYQQRSALTSVSQPVGTAPTQALGAALFAASGGWRDFLRCRLDCPITKTSSCFRKSCNQEVAWRFMIRRRDNSM